MTIASAFNAIAVAQGGTANTSGTISGAIDALNDALAGSDQQGAQTIEQAVLLLGDHIGGGGGTCNIYCLDTDMEPIESVVYIATATGGVWSASGGKVDSAQAGSMLIVQAPAVIEACAYYHDPMPQQPEMVPFMTNPGSDDALVVMPAHDLIFLIS